MTRNIIHGQLGFKNQVNKAREILGLPISGRRNIGELELAREEKRRELIDFLRKDRSKATTKNIIARGGLGGILQKAYQGRVRKARLDAGIVPDGWVLSAQRARELGISRQRMSQLTQQKRLPSVRIGHDLYVPGDAQRQMRQGVDLTREGVFNSAPVLMLKKEKQS